MVQKLRYRRGLYQNFRVFLFTGVRSIEHALKSQLSKCYASPDEVTILFFFYLANVALRCCCCCIGMMKNAVKQFLTI